MVETVENKKIFFLTALLPLPTHKEMYSMIKITIKASRIPLRINYFDCVMFVVYKDMLIKNRINNMVDMILQALESMNMWTFWLIKFYGGESFIVGFRRYIVFLIENHILLSLESLAKPVTYDLIFWKLLTDNPINILSMIMLPKKKNMLKKYSIQIL